MTSGAYQPHTDSMAVDGNWQAFSNEFLHTCSACKIPWAKRSRRIVTQGDQTPELGHPHLVWEHPAILVTELGFLSRVGMMGIAMLHIHGTHQFR
jgi:hypothetical protein